MVVMTVLVLMPLILGPILFCSCRLPADNSISDLEDALLGVFGVIFVVGLMRGVIFKDSLKKFEKYLEVRVHVRMLVSPL